MPSPGIRRPVALAAFLFILLALFSNNPVAAEESCNLLPDPSRPGAKVENLTGTLFVEKQLLSVNDLPDFPGEPRRLENLNLGFSEPFWIQFCVKNVSAHYWFGELVILNAFVQSLDFYTDANAPGAGIWEEKKLNLNRFISSSISVPPGATVKYRIRFDAKLPARLPMILQSGRVDASWVVLMDGITMGSGFILILYSLTIWLFSREKDYLYYAALLLLFLLHRSFFQGIMNFLLPATVLEYRLEFTLSAVCALHMFLFLWLDSFAGKTLRGTFWARIPPITASFYLVILLLSWFIPFKVNQLIYAVVVPATLMVTVLSFAALGKGFRPARFFFVANLGYPMAALLGTVLQKNAETPALVVLHFIDLGILYQMAFFSLAIADKIRFRNEKREENLERIVEERTANLQRMVEEKVEAQKKAEQASRSKSEFLANMSHEIRTPMNALLGTAELLGYTELSEEQRKHLQVFQTAGRTLMNILNDILDISRIESDQIEIETEPFSPRELLRTLELTYAPNPGHPVLLRFSAWDLPPRLLGDPHRLFQIIGNLVSNALKFTDQGWIEVRSKYRGSGKEGELIVEVEDTGRGIPEEKQPRLFQRFYQIKDGQKTMVSGTGLGLSICQSLVSRMKGTIDVKSRPGEGSLFTVRIPLQEATAGVQEVQPEVLQPASVKPLNILAVDDNPDNLYLLERLLQRLGHKTVSSPNPTEALHLLTENWFDLVILDIQMPEIDGFQLLKLIRSRELFPSNKPIVAITAYAAPEDRRQVLEAGFSAYLSKPIRPKALNEMLYSLFGNRNGAGSNFS